MHCTTLSTKRNDCVHLAYFSFLTTIVVQLWYGNVLLTPTVCVSDTRIHCTPRIYLNEQHTANFIACHCENICTEILL